MSALIPDLQNLSNEYLDPISYLNLVAENPKSFNKKTYKKILKNYESTFPLQFFTEAWNKTQEMMKNFKSLKVDPKFMCSLVIKYASTTSAEIEGVFDFSHEIFDQIDDTREAHNNLFDIDYNEILGYMEDQKLADEIEKLDVKNQKALLLEARKILIETDPDIYDTTDPLGTEYAEKMTPILQDLLARRGA